MAAPRAWLLGVAGAWLCACALPWERFSLVDAEAGAPVDGRGMQDGAATDATLDAPELGMDGAQEEPFDAPSDAASDPALDADGAPDADAGMVTPPDAPTRLGMVLGVALGDSHSCAWNDLGQVFCWGSNSQGQLGAAAPSVTSRPVYVALPAGELALSVSAGRNHSCAVTRSRAVYCWGRNVAGQLGTGNTTAVFGPQQVRLLPPAVAVVAGDGHSCAEVQGSPPQVWCWGDNTYGQSGSSTDTAHPVLLPAQVSVPGGLHNPAAGLNFACAQSVADDSVFCWGRDNAGTLGDALATPTLCGSDRCAPFPVRVVAPAMPDAGVDAGMSLVQGVPVAHNNSACAVNPTGALRCWGSNSGIYLVPSGSSVTAATAVSWGAGAAQVALGGRSACVRVGGASPEVRCHGTGYAGELGAGVTEVTGVTERSVTLPAAPTFLAAGNNHYCAVLADGTVRCWGDNLVGELGDGRAFFHLDPQPVVDRAGASLVASRLTAGANHACALTAAGGVQCWGLSDTGQTGSGLTSGVYQPRALPVTSLLAPVAELDAGDAFTCVRLQGAPGTVLCFGANTGQALGLATNVTSQTAPAPIGGLTAPTTLRAGARAACVLDGTAVRCWGGNDAAQLGLGMLDAAAPASSPTGLLAAVGGAAQGLGVGGNHACAVLASDQTLRCWGDNDFNDVSTATAHPTVAPSPVAGLTLAVASVSLGAGGSCALTAGAGPQVRCWGHNDRGQAGVGVLSAMVGTLAPVSFPTGAAAPAEVAVGTNHACARMQDGAVFCWGANDQGQLAGGDPAGAPSVPTAMAVPLRDAQELAAGGAFTCARRADNTVWCWGDARYGQLGRAGDTPLSATPLAVVDP